jgi:hypothetical protein
VRIRLLALALLLAAAALHLGITLTARESAASAQAAYRRARDARREVTQRLAAAERRATARQRLRAVLASAQKGPGDEVARLRRDAIAAARNAGVTAVRLEVTRGRAPVAAALSMSAEGSLPELSALAADLPTLRAVVVESARFDAVQGGLSIELRGVRPGGGL